MTTIKNIDLNPEEKDRIVREVYEDKPGCGIVHAGKYHVLAYKPILSSGPISKSRCIGVELFIRKVDDSPKQWTPECKVLYKQSLFAVKESFKDRLDFAIKEQTATTISLDKAIDDEISRIAKEKRDREKAIEDHINHTRNCQLKIDSTIKTLVPKAKSMIEVNSERLLAEKAQGEERKAALDSIEETTKSFAPVFPDLKPLVGSDYESEIEKQRDVNNLLLNQRTKRVVPEVVEYPTIGRCKEPAILIIKEKNTVECELVMPGDSNYSTSGEKNSVVL